MHNYSGMYTIRELVKTFFEPLLQRMEAVEAIELRKSGKRDLAA
jgi:hypothetical protein